MRTVLALAPYPETAPSTRFRLVELRGALEELDVRMDLHPFVSVEAYRRIKGGGSFLRRGAALVEAFETLRGVLDRATTYDVVLVQRGMGLMLDGSLLDALTRRGSPLVYDFDDAVFLRQEGGRPWLEALRRPGETTARFCRAADVVLAGNAYLADFARQARREDRADRVRLLPSVVNTRRYVPRPGVGSSTPTLGWVGSDSTVPYLETLAPALRELAERRPHRLVVVAGDRRPELPGVRYDFVPWRARDEVGHFQELDVGLYPLPETPWSEGKCGFKAIQYLACGVPCVASPTGVLKDIVRPEETGLHAEASTDWVEACDRLLGDAQGRRRMGAAGRALVEERYSVAVAAPLLASAVREVSAPQPRAAARRKR